MADAPPADTSSGLTLDQVDQLVGAADPQSWYDQADRLDHVQQTLSDVSARTRSESRLADGNVGAYADTYSQRVGEVARNVDQIAQEPDYGAPLRRIGDALATAQRRVKDLKLQRSEKPETDPATFDEQARAAYTDLADAYQEAGNSITSGTTASSGEQTGVVEEPPAGNSSTATEQPALTSSGAGSGATTTTGASESAGAAADSWGNGAGGGGWAGGRGGGPGGGRGWGWGGWAGGRGGGRPAEETATDAADGQPEGAGWPGVLGRNATPADSAPADSAPADSSPQETESADVATEADGQGWLPAMSAMTGPSIGRTRLRGRFSANTALDGEDGANPERTELNSADVNDSGLSRENLDNTDVDNGSESPVQPVATATSATSSPPGAGGQGRGAVPTMTEAPATAPAHVATGGAAALSTGEAAVAGPTAPANVQAGAALGLSPVSPPGTPAAAEAPVAASGSAAAGGMSDGVPYGAPMMGVGVGGPSLGRPPTAGGKSRQTAEPESWEAENCPFPVLGRRTRKPAPARAVPLPESGLPELPPELSRGAEPRIA